MSVGGRMVRSFARDRRGATAVTFGMVALMLATAVGAAIDYNRAISARTAGQAAIDIAVLAAATEKDATFRDVGKKTIKLALANGYSIENLTFERPAPDRTTASGTVKLPTTFTGLLGLDTLDIRVEAEAVYQPGSTPSGGGEETPPTGGGGSGGGSGSSPGAARPCIYLKGSGSQALLMNGGAALVGSECTIEVYSTASPAAIFNSKTRPEVSKICVAGTKVIENGAPVLALEKGCSPAADPIEAHLPPAPDVSTCTFKGKSYDGDTITLKPGVYCGDHNFNRPGTVTFEPGVYALKSGKFNVNGGTWEGTGVTFYFADENATMQFNSGVKAKLAPPAGGDYAGFLFFEKPGLKKRQWVFNPTSGHAFSGIFWLPSRNVTLNASADATLSNVTMVFDSMIVNTAEWKFGPYTAPKPKSPSDAGDGSGGTDGGGSPSTPASASTLKVPRLVR